MASTEHLYGFITCFESIDCLNNIVAGMCLWCSVGMEEPTRHSDEIMECFQ